MPAQKDPNKRAEWIKKSSDKLHGKPKSEEHRRKIREAQLGKIVAEETGKRISEARTGIPLSEEHRRKIRETKIGKHPSGESRRKISEAQK